MQQSEPTLSIAGNIRYNMTNDYMFRAILQSNPKILKGLLISLLHIPAEEIESISIENPILLGESYRDKKYILDILVKLNQCAFINLEMQLINKHNWNDRSLLYLCRIYSNVDIGDDYSEVLPAIHIGFLNFTHSPDNPKFYSTFKLLDTQNYNAYSDKFVLSVVDLTQIELATEEDKAYQTDRWAKIFKATTWEELRMLTKDNEYMEEVTKTLYKCNLDPKICKQCQDWEFEQKLLRMDQRQREKEAQERIRQAQEIDKQAQEIDKQAQEINRLSDENLRLKAQLAALTAAQKQD